MEENLLEKDLIIGKFYLSTYDYDKSQYVFRYDSKEKHPYARFNRGDFSWNGNIITSKNSNFKHYREATSEEANWLDLCIKANKFVPKPTELPILTYSIY